jgi:hypothetical protein
VTPAGPRPMLGESAQSAWPTGGRDNLGDRA